MIPGTGQDDEGIGPSPEPVSKKWRRMKEVIKEIIPALADETK